MLQIWREPSFDGKNFPEWIAQVAGWLINIMVKSEGD